MQQISAGNKEREKEIYLAKETREALMRFVKGLISLTRGDNTVETFLSLNLGLPLVRSRRRPQQRLQHCKRRD